MLIDPRDGQWRAEGVDRTELVAEAADLDALRPVIIEAASARRKQEGLEAMTWRIVETKLDSITLFEVLEIPPVARPGHE